MLGSCLNFNSDTKEVVRAEEIILDNLERIKEKWNEVFINSGIHWEDLDEDLSNIKEAIELCLEDENNEELPEFIGIQKVSV